MTKSLWMGLVALFFVGGCGLRQPQAPQRRAFLNESLVVSVPSRVSASLVQALRSDQTLNDGSVGVQISAAAAQSSTSSVKTKAYVDALTDAQMKAQAIAARLRVSLGRVASVAEISSGGYSSATENGSPKAQSLAVRAPVISPQSNGLTMLAVAYLGSVPISVFGISRGAQLPPSLGSSDGVQVSLQASGSDYGVVNAKMQHAEDEVKKVAQHVGGPGAQVTVRSASSNSY